MDGRTFEIEKSSTQECWAELLDGRVRIHRAVHPPDGEDEVVLEWDIEVLRSLLTWADQDGPVSAFFAGPMAHQIRQHSKELGMMPEMFVWHAVKIFIEVGAEP